MSGQGGFLANVVDRLVSKKEEPNEYQRRQETPLDDVIDSDASTINGIRKNLRLDSSKTLMSDITALSRYGTHRSVSGDGDDPPQLLLLGLAEIEVSVNNEKSKISVTDDDVPGGFETSGSEEEEELLVDGGLYSA
jgi:hypothetical protein